MLIRSVKATNTMVGKLAYQVAVMCCPDVIPNVNSCLEECGVGKVELSFVQISNSKKGMYFTCITYTTFNRLYAIDTSACLAVPLLQQRMLRTRLNADSSQKPSEVFYCYYSSCLVSFQPGLQYKLFVKIGL